MLKSLLLVLFIGIIVVSIIIIRDTTRFVIVPYEIVSPKIKEKTTFVVLSDLHNKSFGTQNTKLIKAIEEISPHGILIAGDMITATANDGYENAVALLRALSPKWPIYYANGNHEYKIKHSTNTYVSLQEGYSKELARMKIDPLVNTNVALPFSNIWITGLEIEKEYYKRFQINTMEEGYIEGLCGRAKEDSFQILLAHNPDYFKEYAKWGADLVLSGHVHGGIVRIPFLGGLLSPSVKFFPEYDGGLYEEGNSKMILSRGLGTHTIPIRVLNPGELIVVTLKPEG